MASKTSSSTTATPTADYTVGHATAITKGCSPKRAGLWADKFGGCTISALDYKSAPQGQVAVHLLSPAGDPIATAFGPTARPAYGAMHVLLTQILLPLAKSNAAPQPLATPAETTTAA